MMNKKDDFLIYKKLLIFKMSPLSEEEQLKILDSMFITFIQYNKDLLFISDGKIGKISSRVAFETMAYMNLTVKFPTLDIKSYDKDKKRYRWNLKISDIYDTITTINNYELLVYESDLFAHVQKIEIDSISKCITVITNKLHIKEPEKLNIPLEIRDEIINDYKEHFPYFDDFITLIMSMRLAKNRKASFLHLRVKSNWGKSFLSGILQNLQIGFEIDYHNLMNKGANDISPIQVRNSFVLIVDEFNNFSAEMKKLSHDFKFAPKFGMTEKVELFLKVLFSAEKSPSFAGGVDEQIKNRVMVMDIPDKEAGMLTDREIYKKHGNALYMAVLERYTWEILTIQLELYLNMEKFQAHKYADEQILTYLNKFKMKDTKNLNDETKETINDTIEEILQSNSEEINPKYRDLKSKIFLLEDGKIFIKQPKRTIEIILKNSVSESDFKKMKWKLSNIDDILDIVSKKPIFIYGKTHKGIKIEIKKTAKEIIEDLRIKGNLIIN